MSNKVFGLVACFVVLLSSAIAPTSSDISINQMLMNTVIVECLQDGEIIGHGSGVFLNRSEILTCNHVSSMGDSVNVIDYFGNSHYVLKIRSEEKYDLAILVVDPTNTPVFVKALRFGKADVGDVVYAVGTPFREYYAFTLTKGIVSAVRLWDQTLIQHDTAINPGNSGGPLFNEYGELIGINAMMAGIVPQWCGISLAISSDDIQLFYDDYKNGLLDPPTFEEIALEIWEKWNAL